MPNALSTTSVTLPRSVATVVTGKAKDTSTIAALSPSKPEIFADETYLVFTGNSEAEVIGEGEAKGSYDQDLAPIVGKRFTVQTTTRMSNQLLWADEDNQLEIIDSIQEDQASALGRALDYVVYHAINPRTGEALNGYDALVDEAEQVYLGKALTAASDKELIASIDDVAEAVSDLYDVNGIALAKNYVGKLRRIRVGNTMARMFPDIPLNLQPGTLEGIKAATSGTVNGRLVKRVAGTEASFGTDVLGICGDFSMIKWGMVRDIKAEIIPYGDPDGKGDLKRFNQIAYRTEAVYAYAVVQKAALAVLRASAKPAAE